MSISWENTDFEIFEDEQLEFRQEWARINNMKQSAKSERLLSFVFNALAIGSVAITNQLEFAESGKYTSILMNSTVQQSFWYATAGLSAFCGAVTAFNAVNEHRKFRNTVENYEWGD